MSVLKRDTELNFPHYVVLKASAGSGKTWALTSRYVQMLLSENISHNGLRNILAITFSKNAAKEMKERILEWLKKLYFKEDEAITLFSDLLTFPSGDFVDRISRKAGEALEEILNNYSDFQVRTIDSFMSSIFKASAQDFGYHPDFEILMNNEELMSYAFDHFLRDVRDGSPLAERFEEAIEIIGEIKESYNWDPSKDIFKKWRDIYRVITSRDKKLKVDGELINKKEKLEEELIECMKEIMDIVKNLDPAYRDRRCRIYDKFPSIIEKRDFSLFFKMKINRPPLKAGVDIRVEELWKRLLSIVSEYAWIISIHAYYPYARLITEFLDELERIKRREGKIFIEDINRKLVQYLDSESIPEVYFRLGEKIYHYLIDEFQDTSPLQWKNLLPLIENSLSGYGSLFVVGDTKQAIYGFRGADYKIMKRLEEENPFPSATKIVTELQTNYRSAGEIVRFNERLFKERAASMERYRLSASLSGLDSYIQKPHESKTNRGYVEVRVFDEVEAKDYIARLIQELHERGYNYRDISILAFKNEQIVNISSKLNEYGIPFLSFSNLDVRTRKVTGEIRHLLKFLDSPVDDFSFKTFLLGDLYRRYLSWRSNSSGLSPLPIHSFLLKYRKRDRLYKAFQEEFPELWRDHFEPLFRLSGYLPLYDLLSMIAEIFRVFEIMKEEEATFLKLFELARLFEGMGFGAIQDFIDFLSQGNEDTDLWNIRLSAGDAVRLMTIHKAKGLEFPVSIVYLEEKRDQPLREYIYEGSGSQTVTSPLIGDEGIYIMKITKDLGERNPDIERIREIKMRENLTDSLNALYVGLTRAVEELYVVLKSNSGEVTVGDEVTVAGTREGEGTHLFPHDLLIDEKGTHGERPSPTVTSPLSEGLGLRRQERERGDQDTEAVYIEHYAFMGDQVTGSRSPVREREIHLYEKVRGEFIHEVLSEIEFYEEDLPVKLQEIVTRLNDKYKYLGILSPHEISELVLFIVRSSEVSPYFQRIPGRIIKNEKEFSDRNGNLYRMDRVVIDPATVTSPPIVTVIDYKTGHPDEEELQEDMDQVRRYKDILRELYPQKMIRGLLYYIDRREVVEI